MRVGLHISIRLLVLFFVLLFSLLSAFVCLTGGSNLFIVTLVLRFLGLFLFSNHSCLGKDLRCWPLWAGVLLASVLFFFWGCFLNGKTPILAETNHFSIVCNTTSHLPFSRMMAPRFTMQEHQVHLAAGSWYWRHQRVQGTAKHGLYPRQFLSLRWFLVPSNHSASDADEDVWPLLLLLASRLEVRTPREAAALVLIVVRWAAGGGPKERKRKRDD